MHVRTKQSVGPPSPPDSGGAGHDSGTGYRYSRWVGGRCQWGRRSGIDRTPGGDMAFRVNKAATRARRRLPGDLDRQDPSLTLRHNLVGRQSAERDGQMVQSLDTREGSFTSSSVDGEEREGSFVATAFAGRCFSGSARSVLAAGGTVRRSIGHRASRLGPRRRPNTGGSSLWRARRRAPGGVGSDSRARSGESAAGVRALAGNFGFVGRAVMGSARPSRSAARTAVVQWRKRVWCWFVCESASAAGRIRSVASGWVGSGSCARLASSARRAAMYSGYSIVREDKPVERCRLMPGVQVDDVSGIRPPLELLEVMKVLTWVQSAAPGRSGSTAFALITPPAAADGGPPVAATDMRTLAHTLRLAPAQSRAPDLGARVVVERAPKSPGARQILPPLHVWLQFPRSPAQLLLPGSVAWKAQVNAGRPICLLVGLDPLPAGVERRQYLARALSGGRVLMGRTRKQMLRTPWRGDGCPGRSIRRPTRFVAELARHRVPFDKTPESYEDGLHLCGAMLWLRSITPQS